MYPAKVMHARIKPQNSDTITSFTKLAELRKSPLSSRLLRFLILTQSPQASFLKLQEHAQALHGHRDSLVQAVNGCL
jgi:hypothetical protein